MIRIGDFSRLAQVTVVTLRHYDDVGLLRPLHVDAATGYRYYTLEQLPRLNRILALRDLGLSLEQIREVLRHEVSAAQLHGMLRSKQAELARRLATEQARLARVETRLRMIEQEYTMPTYDVILKTVEPQTVLAAREVVPSIPEMGDRCEARIQAILAALDRNEANRAGSWLQLYHQTGWQERDIDVETAVIVDAPTTHETSARVTPWALLRTLPSETVAAVVHTGSHATIREAYHVIFAWIDANNYHITGPSREIYLRGDMETANPEEYVTEILFPVAGS